MRGRRWRRLLLRVLLLLVLLAGVGVASAWASFGGRATGARLDRIRQSPQWHDGMFQNPQAMWNDVTGALTGFMRARRENTAPDSGAVRVATPGARFAAQGSGHRSAGHLVRALRHAGRD